jgi:excisionase family DNA binding protein
MSEKYYTVDEIAAMIKIHPKTVQRYIREGKLRANKVGKGWRVSGHDLSTFTENSSLPDQTSSEAGAAAERAEIKMSAVIDIPETDVQESVRIANALTAALNSKPSEFGYATLSTQYLMPERITRVMLWGSLEFTKIMLDFISEFAGKGN